jgi:hypothetical protein
VLEEESPLQLGLGLISYASRKEGCDWVLGRSHNSKPNAVPD